ncbi:MAG: class I SAM-dependent methyltransferase [Verrucomicrobiota bacterium]
MNKINPPIPQLWTEEIELLARVVSDLPEQSNIVEIGTAQGGGFHLIANSRKTPKTIALHSFDPFPGKAVSSLVRMHKNVFSHPVISLQGAKKWLPMAQGNVNLLIIDGSHTLESVHQDYTSWKRHLSQPSEIIFHDYDSIVRDGASHPAVKVFCDSLLSRASKNAMIKGRAGRYLHVLLKKTPAITLNDLKGGFTTWITNATQIAKGYRSNRPELADALIDQLACHSRLARQATRSQEATTTRSDLAFTIHAASSVAAIHEILLDRTNDRAFALKWIECLEMFLHARSWDAGSIIDTKRSPILRACDECTNISSLSRLCADISLLVALIEILFTKGIKSPQSGSKA